jgi:uncharacterized membrane protein YphA (DoxX/SURF4 family)
MNASITLAVLVTLIFALLGTAKIMAVPPMRYLASEAGFSVDAYRGIGVLEVAGAVGVALGLAVPLLGRVAAVGLLLLLAGALITHIRQGDEPRKYAPVIVCGVLVAGYLAALNGAIA